MQQIDSHVVIAEEFTRLTAGESTVLKRAVAQLHTIAPNAPKKVLPHPSGPSRLLPVESFLTLVLKSQGWGELNRANPNPSMFR